MAVIVTLPHAYTYLWGQLYNKRPEMPNYTHDGPECTNAGNAGTSII